VKHKTEVVYLSRASELVEGVQVESNPSRSRAPFQGIQVIERIQVEAVRRRRVQVGERVESRQSIEGEDLSNESKSKANPSKANPGRGRKHPSKVSPGPD
jgi:hypothetical protein